MSLLRARESALLFLRVPFLNLYRSKTSVSRQRNADKNLQQTYPFVRAERAIPTLEFLTLRILLAFGFHASMKLEIAGPAMFCLILGGKALVTRRRADANRLLLGHGDLAFGKFLQPRLANNGLLAK